MQVKRLCQLRFAVRKTLFSPLFERKSLFERQSTYELCFTKVRMFIYSFGF